MIIAITSSKGGAGKTTLTSIAAASIYAKTDLKVVMVDLDPQGSLTSKRKKDTRDLTDIHVRSNLYRKQYRILEEYMTKNNLVINKKSGLIKEIVLQSITEQNIWLKKQNDPKLIYEVNKIGININQLTKKLNSLDALSGADLDRIRKLISKMSDFISQA